MLLPLSLLLETKRPQTFLYHLQEMARPQTPFSHLWERGGGEGKPSERKKRAPSPEPNLCAPTRPTPKHGSGTTCAHIASWA